MRRTLARIGKCMLAVLVCVDQFLQTVCVAPFAIVGLAPIPDPDATISGLLGRGIGAQRRWALLPAAIVDALFLILTLGQERDHCRKTADREVRPAPV